MFGDGTVSEPKWTDTTLTIRWIANSESANAPKSGIYTIDLKTGKLTLVELIVEISTSVVPILLPNR